MVTVKQFWAKLTGTQPLTETVDESPEDSEQTAEIASLHREFANHPTRGLSPARLAAIFETAERGDLLAQCDLFEDMEEKDGHIMAELGKRKRALLGLDWDISPPDQATAEEIKISTAMKAIFVGLDNIEDVFLDLADAIGYGYSCLAIEWVNQDNVWIPKALHHRPPRWFTVNDEDRNTLRLRDNSSEGVVLWPLGWLVHIHKAKSGDLARGGLHRALAWPFLFKNYSVRDLAEFLEIYGLPVRLGQYPPGASESEKATLLRAVVNMGHSAAGIIPENMQVEFKEAAEGGSDPYKAMIDWCEKTQSKCILGGTLTSQADGQSSTNALGNVHNEVRHDLLIADAMQIGRTLSQLAKMICQLNGWSIDSHRYPRFAFDLVEPENLLAYADALPKLVDVGFSIPTSYVYDKLRIPEPVDNEPILQRAAVATTQAALAAKVGDELQDPTPIDTHTQQLAEQTAILTQDWISILKAKVDQAESLEALQTLLLDSYGDLDSESLTQVMTLAFASAELSGRFDVSEGE